MREFRGKAFMNYIFCAIYVTFSILGLTFMKLGSVKTELAAITIPIVELRLNIITIIGYLCYVCSFLLYTVVITKFDLGVIIPLLSGITNIIIFIVALVVFKEHFTSYSIIGILLISIGVVLMNIKK